jgi:hypothetical protein
VVVRHCADTIIVSEGRLCGRATTSELGDGLGVFSIGVVQGSGDSYVFVL